MEVLSEIAKACGFDACGVVPVDVLSRERERLERWIRQGFHAGMNYMANNIEKRENPALLVEGHFSEKPILCCFLFVTIAHSM